MDTVRARPPMRAREVLVWQEFGGWAGGEDPNLFVPRSFRILRDGIFEVETPYRSYLLL